MKRPSYRDAIYWIAANDDTQFMSCPGDPMSVTLAFVCDMFEVSEEKARKDLAKQLERIKHG